MCTVRMGPRVGIPITEDIHNRYPEEVKKAWAIFHEWYQEASEGNTKQVREADMPEEIKKAWKLILETPIPGYPGLTGANSCYAIGASQKII
ncbi:MAG: hypothetical protein Q7S03_04035 [bacterium]|nr:hypothetical protein [bacterium]